MKFGIANKRSVRCCPVSIVNRDDTWPTNGLSEGVYTLVLSVASADYNASTNATVTLLAAMPTIALSGSLAFDPGTTLIAGDSVVLNYRVANPGTTDLTGIQTRVRIVAGKDKAPESETDASFDLAAGASKDAALTLTAPPLALTSHLAILEARLPGDPADQWRLLAQQGFSVVDLLPPVITVMSPPSDVVQPAVVPLLASIVDAHSAIASAQVSVDDGTWQPVSAGIDGNYARGLTGLGDGAHSLRVRATDTWGNQAQTDPQSFTVDATPPLITIAGVSDGDLVNHAVVPTVTITDANLATSDVRLNGDTFVSATSVDADGYYVLTARATDAAGNQTTASVRFSIDTVAPSVAITTPSDGATLYQAAIHVDVQTEAAATVGLVVGGYTASATADDQGHAGFDAVPMAPGANQIQATATDKAGNIGGPVSSNVNYATVAITGTIGPLQTPLAQGVLMDAQYTMHNNGDIDLMALPSRIEMRPVNGGDVVATEDFTVNLPVGANIADIRSIKTHSVLPGKYDVVLMVNMPATPGPAGWVDLNSTVFDPCRFRNRDVIFADGFDGVVVAGGDEIFCNGFETLIEGAYSASATPSPWAGSVAMMGDVLLDVVGDSPVVRAIAQMIGQETAYRHAKLATQRLPKVVPVASRSKLTRERRASAALKPRRVHRQAPALATVARDADIPSAFDSEYDFVRGDIHVGAAPEFGGLR